MASTLRVAIVGGGLRGSMFARVAEEHDGAELVGFCELSANTAQELRASFGVPVHETVTDLLDRERPDAVVVATPDYAHLGPGLACLERGVHLLVEKPLATDVEEARRLREAAQSSAGHVMLGFENRWNPRFQTVRRLLAGAGQPLIAQRALLQDTDEVPRRMLSWAAKSTPGWFLFPHSLDMATWLSGADPVEVYARGVKKVLTADGIDTWDRISASVRMSDDSIVGLDSGWVLPGARPAVFQFRFDVETATDQFEIEIDRSGVTRYAPSSVAYAQGPDTDARGRLVGAPVEMMRDFIDLCRGHDIDVPGIEEGYRNTVAIAALHESLQTNTNIAISY